MEQKLTKEQYDEILKELREIKKILASKATEGSGCGSKNSGFGSDRGDSMHGTEDTKKVDNKLVNETEKVEKEVKEFVSKKEDEDDDEDIKDIVDRICGRIDSMCHKMNDAILDAYGMPTFSRRRCRNVWRPFYCGEDGINSTRCSSTGYRY